MYKTLLCLLFLCLAHTALAITNKCSAQAIVVETAGEWQEGNIQKRVFELNLVNTHEMCTIKGALTLKINAPAGSRVTYTWGMPEGQVTGLTIAPGQTHSGLGFILSGAGTPTVDVQEIGQCECPNDPTLGPTDPTEIPTAPPSTPHPTRPPTTPKPNIPPTGALGYYTLGMKVAIFTCDASAETEVRLPVAKLMNDMTGSQYDVFDNAKWRNGTLAASLRNSDGNGKYYAFIATMELSCWSANQTSEIAAYEYEFNVKMVILYSYPYDTNGVHMDSSVEVYTADASTLTFDESLYPSMRSLRHDLEVPVPGGIRPATLKTYAYLTSITNDSMATAALWINYKGADHVAGAFIHLSNPPRTHLEVYVNQADWALYSRIIGIAAFEWVTNGIFAGARRIEFNLHMDDVFMFTGRYDKAIGSESEDDKNRARISVSDVEKVRDWQKSWNDDLPKGSNFTLTFPYNYGTVEKDLNGVDDLFERCKKKDILESFIWESHTYTHPYLYGLSYQAVVDEYTKNLKGALELFNVTSFDDIPKHLYCNISTVTPSISGLNETNPLHALFDMGFKFVVGDNSIPFFVPENLYHTIHTNSTYGYDGVIIVPRHATNIYYMADRPEHIVDFYNLHYNETEGISTMDEIVERDVEVALRALMAYRHDPFMFHQANMVWLSGNQYPDGGEHCLLSYWTDRVLEELESYNNLPVISRTHDQLGQMFLDREDRDACGFNATIKFDREHGVAVGIHAASSNKCVYGVSGAEIAGTQVQKFEEYGAETTTWFNMDAGSDFYLDFTKPVYPIYINA